MIGAVCGLNQHGVGATAGNVKDHTSGLEARFQAEVAHATLGMTRTQVSECVLDCLSHYEQTLAHPNLGKPFNELYDMDTLEPKNEWLEIYNQVRHGLNKMGFDLDLGWRKAHYDGTL
jgi:methylamine---corrinoid protein Co-methyltransferase